MRFLSRTLSLLALAGYLTVTIGGVWLHDHDHHELGCDRVRADATEGHSDCGCGHHHATCPIPESDAVDDEAPPCRHDGRDDGCLICQTLADKPIPVAVVKVPDAIGVVTVWVSPARPAVTAEPPSLCRARAPPAA